MHERWFSRPASNSRIWKSGGDYPVRAILEAVVDHHFVALDRIEDPVEESTTSF